MSARPDMLNTSRAARKCVTDCDLLQPRKSFVRRGKQTTPASRPPDGFRQSNPDHPFIAETARHLLHPQLHVLCAGADMPVGDLASVGFLRVDFTAVLGDVQAVLDLAKAGVEFPKRALFLKRCGSPLRPFALAPVSIWPPVSCCPRGNARAG